MSTPDPKLVEAVAHCIMLKLQLHDFGHVVEDEFRTSVGKVEEFIRLCNEAATDIIPIIEAATLERAAKDFRQALARYAAPDDVVPMQGVLDIVAALTQAPESAA